MRLERKRAAVEHSDVQHRVSGFLGFDRQPQGFLFIPCIFGAPAQCEKVVPSCKLTGRLPIESKPVDNIPQKKRSTLNSFFPRQQGFPCPDAIIISIDDRRGHNPIFLIQSAANNQQKRNIDITGNYQA